MKHKATGRPRGRPVKLPPDLPEQIMRDLESRMDAATRLVEPQQKAMSKRLSVSRSSLRRKIEVLRKDGFIETKYIPSETDSGNIRRVYKLLKSPADLHVGS
ncbi:MAG: hypothetical protein II649_01565 [Kiritimatiellae bacterium]|nr:hypothetical protein [Kiritimatiellia bacterium]